MLHSVIVFAQEAAHEEESSKAAYYIAGSALALFAVIISAIGIRGHEHFPSRKGGRNIVILLCATLVAATAATAVLTG